MYLNEEKKALFNTVKEFVKKEIKPFADEWEQNGFFPAHDLFKKNG